MASFEDTTYSILFEEEEGNFILIGGTPSVFN